MKRWEPAYDDWKAGMKYKEIAEKYGVSESAVKSWVSRYFKPKQAEEGKKKVATKSRKVATSTDKKTQPKKRGAPHGNKNAVGNSGGAPLGNQNNFKHGLYSKVYLDTLDDKEQDLLQELSDDEEDLLLQQIDLFTIRERRHLLSIKQYQENIAGLSISRVIRSEWKDEKPKSASPETEWSDDGEKDSKGRRKKHSYHLDTCTVANIEILERLEESLTRIQAKKTKAIETLNAIRKAKRETDKGNGDELVDEWITAVTEDKEKSV